MQRMFLIAHPSDIAAARRCAVRMAGQLGLDESVCGKLAIVVTETATNILKHAGHGKIVLKPLQRDPAPAVEVLALDSGPGIANLASCLRDGMSTTGTSGTGLGAMRRLAGYFDAYTAAGKGSAFYMRLGSGARAPAPVPAIDIGAVCVPMRGEEFCGDAWSVMMNERSVKVLVADGLGHGPEAARASLAAVQTLWANPDLTASQLLEAIHRALPATRGAAVAVAQPDFHAGQLHFAGIGNICASIVTHESTKNLVSHNGIVGHNMRKVQQFTDPLPPDGVCIMHSDGLSAQWDLRAYPGLLMHHPALIAGVLYRDFARDRDDATIVAFRQTGPRQARHG